MRSTKRTGFHATFCGWGLSSALSSQGYEEDPGIFQGADKELSRTFTDYFLNIRSFTANALEKAMRAPIFGKRKASVQPEPGRSEARGTVPGSPSHDTLVLAAAYVGFVSAIDNLPTFQVSSLIEPTACQSSSGAEGVSLLFASEQGVSGIFYFFPEYASVWPTGEASPRVHIPTEMITGFLPEFSEALRQLLATVPRFRFSGEDAAIIARIMGTKSR